MFCIHCGTNIPDDAAFCQHCGREQAKVTNTPAISSNIPLGQGIPHNAVKLSSSVALLSSRERLGSLIVVGGGFVALFAFFVLPYLSLGFFGSLTGSQLASMNNQLIQGMGILWLEPLIALIIIVIGVSLIVSSQKQQMSVQTAKALVSSTIFVSGITLLVLLIKYIADLQPTTSAANSYYTGPSLASFYGAGIWIYFLGILAALVGGIIQLKWLSSKKL